MALFLLHFFNTSRSCRKSSFMRVCGNSGILPSFFLEDRTAQFLTPPCGKRKSPDSRKRPLTEHVLCVIVTLTPANPGFDQGVSCSVQVSSLDCLLNKSLETDAYTECISS